MAQWCKHWDCGWCYHPSSTYNMGCVGIDRCRIIDKSHLEASGDIIEEILIDSLPEDNTVPQESSTEDIDSDPSRLIDPDDEGYF